MTTATWNSIREFWSYGPLGRDYDDHRLKPSSLIFTTLVINLLSLALPILLLQIYDRIIPHRSFGTLAMLVSGVTVALIMEGVLRYCTAYITNWSGAAFEHNATLRALRKMGQADVQLLEMEGTATYLQRLAAIMKLRECYSGRVLMTVIDLPFSLLYLTVVGYLAGWLVIAPIIVASAFIYMALRLGARLRMNMGRHAMADEHKYNFIINVLTGIHSVKSFSMEAQMMRRFEELQTEATQTAHRTGLLSSYTIIMMDVFSNAAMAATVLCGSLLVMKGYLSVGGLAACTLLVGRMMQPLQRALDSWNRFQDFLIARKHSHEVLNLPSRQITTRTLPVPAGEIEIKDATFYYASAGERPIFKNLSLTVRAGEAIGIVAGKGSGRTTLLQMMMGTFAPLQGTVHIDGFDPAAQNATALRSYIAYLPQKSVLFRGTVMENLTGFQPNQERMQNARQICAELGVDEIFNALPQGYHTYLSDGPSDPIAPGVKQRLCLARALNQGARILLFDEADRALDRDGYQRVLEAMWRRHRSCTMIMATDDEEYLALCDRSYYLTSDGLTQMPKLKRR